MTAAAESPQPIQDPPSASTPGESSGDASDGRLDRAYHLLLETARQLGGSLEPDAIFARLKTSVAAAVPCDGLIVSSFERATRQIRCAYAWVGGNLLDPATLPPLTFKAEGGGMQSQVLRSGRPMLFTDVAERVRDPQGTYYEVDRTGGVRDLKSGGPPRSQSAIMVPLRLEGEVVGVVQVMADSESAYTPADLELLEGIALLLAPALENARLYRRAHQELEERRRAESALLEADRRKNEFLATLGHELRNPLHPIRNAVELLRRRPATDPDARRCQDVIDRQVAHLARLIDDLLDVSRISQGKLELRPARVTLQDAIAAALESVGPFLDLARQRLTVEHPGEPVVVDGDPVRLSQVIANLLDNASKYSPHGSDIKVALSRDAEHAALAIFDQGTGIPAEHLPRVFDLFYQAGRVPASSGGLGIGLTLVKRLVEMHGGTIDVSSEGADRGSTFVVRLPLAPAQAPVAAPPPEVAERPRPMRMLVADDHRDAADSMAMLLRLDGNDVHVAYDGEEALRLASEVHPHLLLLDLGMPRLDGLEVAERVRREPWGKDLVMIAMTGWGQEEDRRRTLERGFDAHLVKPLDHAALLALVGELFERRGWTRLEAPEPA
jgi:signal transduction histidine kinase/CheY-like chemotaxis protein